LWLIRIDFVFNSQAIEKDHATFVGMENYLQGDQDGGDEGVIIFSGLADSRTTEDLKRLKLNKNFQINVSCMLLG
jgi:hypothetical protein